MPVADNAYSFRGDRPAGTSTPLLAPRPVMEARPPGHSPALDLAYRLYDEEVVRLERRARLFVDWYGVELDPLEDWLAWCVAHLMGLMQRPVFSPLMGRWRSEARLATLPEVLRDSIVAQEICEEVWATVSRRQANPKPKAKSKASPASRQEGQG